MLPRMTTDPPKQRRKTPQHTVGVDDELWNEVMAIAKKRRERVSDLIRRSLVAYRDEHRELLADD